MKAYKGFNSDLTCRGYQYEEGKTYEEQKAKLCEIGFHACENPVECFDYYAPATSVMHEVELEDVSDERNDDSKVVGKKITIGARLDIPHIVSATFEYVKEHCTNENNAEAGKAASAGEKCAASAGYRGAASAGLCGAASAGSYGAASAGLCGAASAGSYGAASAGSYGAASAGEKGAASAGSCGAAVSRGSAESGENGLAVARGNNVKVKGGLGAILVIAEENDFDLGIKELKAVEVDGEKVKADTWYQLVNGEIIECE